VRGGIHPPGRGRSAKLDGKPTPALESRPAMSTAPVRKLTPEEYLRIERASVDQKHEFYRGEMFAMAGGSRQHNRATFDLNVWLGNQLRDSGCEAFASDMRVLVDRTGLSTYPDIVVTCEEPEFLDEEFDTLLNPQLVVEVFSDESEAVDRGWKFRRYLEMPSLREYVLVSSEAPMIERYSLLDDGRWVLEVAKGLEASIRVDAAEADLPLAEVYRRVEFDEKPQA